MSLKKKGRAGGRKRDLHVIGVLSGIAAGAWLGTAEAPVHLVQEGWDEFVVSAAMVMGVFVARWTVPTLFKGTSYVFADLKGMVHLIVWALLAGALWAVANTLTVFAIKDVGLAVAFPIWNSNCLVGLFWGCLLFNELKGAAPKEWAKVAGGAVVIVTATAVLGFAATKTSGGSTGEALRGVLAALGAGLLWGTMYIPYRKAYLSGMNPLSFVTVFTVGELSTVLVLSASFRGGLGPFANMVVDARPVLFWLFLGGFCWVLGDLFQQFAAKYIGIGRGIPLANTNQLWGLAWAVLVFHSLAGDSVGTFLAILGGCALMIAGAAAIASAEASDEEHVHWDRVIDAECRRYGLDRERIRNALAGEDPLGQEKGGRAWWDFLIVGMATAVFVVLGHWATRPSIFVDLPWMIVVIGLALVVLVFTGWKLYRRTGFS